MPGRRPGPTRSPAIGLGRDRSRPLLRRGSRLPSAVAPVRADHEQQRGLCSPCWAHARPPGHLRAHMEAAAGELTDCARYGEEEEVKQLLAAAAAPAELVNTTAPSGNVALHMAAANGHTVICELLLQAGASVNAKNSAGNTPLHWAALNGHLAAVNVRVAAARCTRRTLGARVASLSCGCSLLRLKRRVAVAPGQRR